MSALRNEVPTSSEIRYLSPSLERVRLVSKRQYRASSYVSAIRELRQRAGSFIHVIQRCLAWHPNDRPDPSALLVDLGSMYPPTLLSDLSSECQAMLARAQPEKLLVSCRAEESYVTSIHRSTKKSIRKAKNSCLYADPDRWASRRQLRQWSRCAG